MQQSVADAAELGLLEGEPDEVLRVIFRPWRSKKMRTWLQTNFPLLNVTDLDTQIKDAIRPVYQEKEAA